MSKTVVVPLLDPQLDPSGVSERALPYAKALLESEDTRLVLVSVVDLLPEVEGVTDAVSEEFASQRQRWIQGWLSDRESYLKTVARDFPEDRVETVVLRGDTTEAVLGLLESLESPMLVMGSHARTGAARMFYGSVTFNLVHDADAPVLVIRRGLAEPSHPKLEKVLVPLDGTVFAEHVLDVVLEYLGDRPLEIHLVHVIDSSRFRANEPVRPPDATPFQWAKQYLVSVAERIESRGYRVTRDIRDGSVAEEIAAAARERDCDLIAMSTNSRGGLSRLIYGSVAEKVLHDAGRPLLLIRPEESASPFGR